MTPPASADYLRGFSSGVEAAEALVADALTRAADEAKLYGPPTAAVVGFVDRLRVELGLAHPFGAHHSAPGLASRLPE